jgi:adenylyltransferase/sulfurtransferase
MITHITPTELKARLDAGDRPTLLDVREGWELDIARLEGVTHIPMNEVPERITELDPSHDTVVLCRSGGRSLKVAEYLVRNGFVRVANLSGGILGWGEDVDPSLRAY